MHVGGQRGRNPVADTPRCGCSSRGDSGDPRCSQSSSRINHPGSSMPHVNARSPHECKWMVEKISGTERQVPVQETSDESALSPPSGRGPTHGCGPCTVASCPGRQCGRGEQKPGRHTSARCSSPPGHLSPDETTMSCHVCVLFPKPSGCVIPRKTLDKSQHSCTLQNPAQPSSPRLRPPEHGASEEHHSPQELRR